MINICDWIREGFKNLSHGNGSLRTTFSQDFLTEKVIEKCNVKIVGGEKIISES